MGDLVDSLDAPAWLAIRKGGTLVKVAFIVAVVFVALNCATTQEQFENAHWDAKSKGPIPEYLATQVETLRPEMLPGSGVYYVYHVSDDGDQFLDVAKKLRRLYALGIYVSMAWYRPPLSGCTDPETGSTTDTIYPQFLLLHLEHRNGSLQKYNFFEVARPTGIPCPYQVSIYYPQFHTEEQAP